MSVHINAKENDIAKVVLLPGDPLRAKFIAENFLQNAICYSQVRGMFGFTGTYNGKTISVQGTGMGQPSFSIYATELLCDYKAKVLIRIGTCGAIQKNINVKDIILVNAASTDSGIQKQRFGDLRFSASCDYDLLKKADIIANNMGLSYKVGSCASSDLFYDENENYKIWAKYGVLGIEMETNELYTLAAKYNAKALSILTVSDHIITGKTTSSMERQTTFTSMMKVALDVAVDFA